MPYADIEKRRSFMREYRNRPEVIEQRKQWLSRPEYKLQVNKKYREKYKNSEVRKKVRDYQKNYYLTRESIHSRFIRYQYEAKVRKLLFILTEEQFEQIVTYPCHYCGVKEWRIGIDRKDNALGYTYENALPCCKICNYAKRKLGYEEFIAHCKRVALINRS